MFHLNNTPQFVCYPNQSVENFTDDSSKNTEQNSILTTATNLFKSNDITAVGTSKNIEQDTNLSVANTTANFLSNIQSNVSNILSDSSSNKVFSFEKSNPITSSVSSSTTVVDGKVNKSICIDNTCLNEQDLKKLIQMIKNLPN